MPFLKVLRTEIVDHRNKSTNYELKTQNCKTKGFTLIELLIVIAIFGLTASLITASYLTFERNQRLKAAAQKIKTDVRFTQNEALSGNKGILGICDTPSILVGYYLNVSTEEGKNTSYKIAGDCRVTTLQGTCPSGATETIFNLRTSMLPSGVKIKSITYGTPLSNPVNILFRPLAQNAIFWDANLDLTPPFLDDSCQPIVGKLLGGTQDDILVIELCREKTPYYVTIRSSGEVYESQPTAQQECTT